ILFFFFDSDFDRYFWKKKNINFTNKTEIINQNCFLCLVKQQQQQRNNQFVITYDDDNINKNNLTMEKRLRIYSIDQYDNNI
ncbi:hypothetical protein DERP_014648, partial [Dermatophagoides pteronyssinus]